MVFGAIDESGSDGIWSQTLEKRLNMHEKVMRTALKHLIGKDLVRQFVNVENPSKKMYIKASIQPSERATGGPWFTDQKFDEAFIEDLQRVIYDYVRRNSTYIQSSRHSAGTGGSHATGAATGQNPRPLQPKK